VTIEETIQKAGSGDQSAKIEIGELVEKNLRGAIGGVLKSLLTGRTELELTKNLNGNLCADRVLGRIEMSHILWNDLVQFIVDKDELVRERPEELSRDVTGVEEPHPTQKEHFSAYGK
jgi:hypothetical protein